MNIESFRLYCLEKPGVTEELPFGPSTLVFKVMGKMFALTGLDSPEFAVNLKCDPTYAEELRAKYSSVIPGYHMNKKHWNTINIYQEELSNELLMELTDHSYDLVSESLTKQLKVALKEMQ
jgi:predicted DNA-binding protein (MmcQ/YjbR family)